MRPLAWAGVLAVGLAGGTVAGQSILFDFDTAPVHAPLPIDLTVGALAAHFAGDFAIQPANTMGLTPVGFAGNCIFPSSIYGSDLTISFLVTPAPPPLVLAQPAMTGPGTFAFTFTNAPARAFSVFGSTNAAAPMGAWNFLGVPAEVTAGEFQFLDLQATNTRMFYRVTSP